jgi:hypothetical protein
MTNPYSYFRPEEDSNCNLKEDTRLWSHYLVDFSSAQSVRYLGNNRVKGEYYLPRNTTVALLAILVHGMGDRSVIPCRIMARTLAKKGIASFILYLVFHKSRKPGVIRRSIPLYLRKNGLKAT